LINGVILFIKNGAKVELVFCFQVTSTNRYVTMRAELDSRPSGGDSMSVRLRSPHQIVKDEYS
jgi:hypothetical protein